MTLLDASLSALMVSAEMGTPPQRMSAGQLVPNGTGKAHSVQKGTQEVSTFYTDCGDDGAKSLLPSSSFRQMQFWTSLDTYP